MNIHLYYIWGVIKELLHHKMCMAVPDARCYDDFLLLYYENSVHGNMEILHHKMCMAAPGTRCYDDFLLLYYENSVHGNMHWIQVIGNQCM